ncbi:MAG: PDR/VanB family oxidoreductase [Pseudonocardiales bacterium]|nr:PDR/VanB family oxidoreductase [Pseudonocardiales bacterium]
MTGPGAQERDLVVDDRTDEADGVVALHLRDPGGAALPAWEPGAHVDLLPDPQRPDLERQYSLCGDPADRTAWRVAVLREPAGRGGSAHVHDTLAKGDVVRVRGPRNHFALEPAAHYLFVAGGIGITPILPMLAAASAAGADWRLVYGGRTAASMAFTAELAAYGDRVALRPQDEHGLLDLDGLLAGRPAGGLVYCCGPGPLLDAMAARCPDGDLRIERFTPVEVDTSGDTAFEAQVGEGGPVLTVPADRPLLDVLEEAGLAPLSSCREGTCGTCETGVLAGEVDHRDALLDADERAAHDVMFPCVSRAACARIVLDL